MSKNAPLQSPRKSQFSEALAGSPGGGSRDVGGRCLTRTDQLIRPTGMSEELGGGSGDEVVVPNQDGPT